VTIDKEEQMRIGKCKMRNAEDKQPRILLCQGYGGTGYTDETDAKKLGFRVRLERLKEKRIAF
jgi:hypothetical protein